MSVKKLLGGNGGVGWSTWPDPFEVGTPTGNTHAATKLYVDTATGLLIPLTYLDTDGTLAANSDSKIATQKATKTFALPASYLDTDGTLAANSDTKVASQKATKTYADAIGGHLTSALALPRRKITGQILLSSAAASGTNYFAATYAAAVNPSGTTIAAFPGVSLADWQLDASLYPAIGSLNPLLRLRATTKVLNTNPNYVMTVGLAPITISGSAISAGALIAGSSTSHTVNTTNNASVSDVTSAIALPASGLYCPVATINQAPTTATTPTQITVDLYYA